MSFEALRKRKEEDDVQESLRYNRGKPDYTFTEPAILEAISRGMTYGASKYARDNWKLSIGGPEHDTFQKSHMESMLRHIYAVAQGEMIDKESGNAHMDHVACNVMMWLTYEEAKHDI
jgi:hypothetical protein